MGKVISYVFIILGTIVSIISFSVLYLATGGNPKIIVMIVGLIAGILMIIAGATNGGREDDK